MKIILKPGHLWKTRWPVIHCLTSLPPPGILFLLRHPAEPQKQKGYSVLFSLWCVAAAFRERGRLQVGFARPDVIPEEASPSSRRCGWARAWGGGWEGPLTATPPCRPAPRRSRSPSRGSEEGSTAGGRVSSEHQTRKLQTARQQREPRHHRHVVTAVWFCTKLLDEILYKPQDTSANV